MPYLNIGCGSHFSTKWTNLDLNSRRHVIGHDVRDPLPFKAASFEAVYSSHLLEHLEPDHGRRLVREMHRVLVPGGVIRVVVPDLEGICREYLARLDDALENPAPDALARYRWIVLELIDQMVRERRGGRMLEMIKRGEVDRDYVAARVGDEVAPFLSATGAGVVSRARRATRTSRAWKDDRRLSLSDLLRTAARRALSTVGLRPSSPKATGESHRWMYDRLSLRLLLESTGFAQVRTVAYDESRIPEWDRYELDTNAAGDGPRKPDSLFVEAVKPRS